MNANKDHAALVGRVLLIIDPTKLTDDGRADVIEALNDAAARLTST